MPKATEIVGGVRLGNHPAGLIPVQLHKSVDLAEVYRHRNFGMCVGRHNEERYAFGLPSLVTFFGGAKKVTDAFVAQ